MSSNILNDLLNKHYTLLTKLKTSTTKATLRRKYKITVIKKVYSCGSKMVRHDNFQTKTGLAAISSWYCDWYMCNIKISSP